MLRICQEGTDYSHDGSGVRGEFSIRPNIPVYMRDAHGSAMMSVLKAALGVSEIAGLTCESGLLDTLSISSALLSLFPNDNESKRDDVYSCISVITVV